MNKPKKAAKLIIKHTKGRINFNSVESWLLSIGYKIIFFNTIAGDVEISRYGLTEKAKIKKAFTYCGNAKIVFIDGTLPSEDKLYLLLHESGHIALGHLNLKRLSTENDTFLEFEVVDCGRLFCRSHPQCRRRYRTCRQSRGYGYYRYVGQCQQDGYNT